MPDGDFPDDVQCPNTLRDWVAFFIGAFLLNIVEALLYHMDKFLKAIPAGVFCMFIYGVSRFSMPRCYVENLYVPALDTFGNSSITGVDNAIFFDLKLENALDQKGVRFDDIDVTLFYGRNKEHPIGNCTVRGFYTGGGKKAERSDVVLTYGVPWDNAFSLASLGSAVVFRLEMATKVRFKYFLIYSNKRKLANGGNVEVGDSGKKNTDKDIRLLKSSATSSRGCYSNTVKRLVVVSILLSTLLL